MAAKTCNTSKDCKGLEVCFNAEIDKNNHDTYKECHVSGGVVFLIAVGVVAAVLCAWLQKPKPVFV